MKSLKTLGVVAVLAAAAGGVYVSLHRPPQWPSFGPDQGTGEPAGTSGQAPQSLSAGTDSRGMGPPFAGVNVTLGTGVTAQEALSGADPGGLASNEERGPSALSGGSAAGMVESGTGFQPTPSSPGSTAMPSSPGQWDLQWPGVLSGGTGSPTNEGSVGHLGGTASPQPGGATASNFPAFMAEVNQLLAQGKLADALERLSQRYDDPSLKPEEYAQVVDLLDQIAYAVIYSPDSVLEPPYVVQPGDTLQRIAQSYGVPWQLLARINGIADPNALRPGQKLKVVRGPFDAEVDLNRRELTLKLHGLYAGRFALPTIVAPERLESTYFVEDKSSVPGYWWIRLSGGVEIRGDKLGTPPRPAAGESPVLAVEADQIENLHTILSVGSRVRILR